METELLIDENGHIVSNVVTKDVPTNRSNSNKRYAPLVAVCLLVALISGVAAIVIVKWKPTKEVEPSLTDSKQFVINALFSTDFNMKTDGTILKINKVNDFTDKLIKIFHQNDDIRIANSKLIHHLESSHYHAMKCREQLNGDLLQLQLILSTAKCSNRNQRICQIEMMKKFEDIFQQLDITPISLQFEDRTVQRINVKLCKLVQPTVEENNLPNIQLKQATMPMRRRTKSNSIRRVDNLNAKRNQPCSLCINKIGLARMPGEYGTLINDPVGQDLTSNENNNQLSTSATVFEENVYQFDVQLDCDKYSGNPCSNSLSILAWVDFNNNGVDDDGSIYLRGTWSDPANPTGAYTGQIQAPSIDGQYIRSGLVPMKVTVAPSQEYQSRCGYVAYQETRSYTINLVAKFRPTVTPKPYIMPAICPVKFPKIILVIMAGEKGSEIRDDIPRSEWTSQYQNQHHMDVTLFENTIYLIRVQLDCSTQLETDLTVTGCNLAQDVSVSIDRNDDGIFDESEIGTPYRWPVTSYMAEGIYDLQVYVPSIRQNDRRGRSHRMRLLVKPSDYYTRNCGYNAYNETREYSVNIIPIVRSRALMSVPTSNVVPRNIECSSDVGKIRLVVLTGEYRTQIRDDPSTRAVINDQHEQHLAITLYEDNVYLLRIQLECTRKYGTDYRRVNCTLPHDVNAWIDLNDDGKFDDSENAAPFRWPLTSYIPEGVYDLQIYVPSIDGRTVKSGPHKMRLVVTLNEDYRLRCGNEYYTETRDYSVTISRYSVEPIETGVPYLALPDDVCYKTQAKIVLVIMTGELGTHIRDDTPLNIIMNNNQNRHHLSVTLYENTVYRIRIQVDCDPTSSRGDYDRQCNLAYDVNVHIDLNDDGNFDENEARVLRRWPLQSSVGLGIYDLNIPIPELSQILRTGVHRMRVVIVPSEEYNNKCGRSSYREVREYSVNIIPRSTYIETAEVYCSSGSLICSVGQTAIYSVRLYGEQSTSIDDQTRSCSSVNNYQDQTSQIVTLYDDTVYTVYVGLFCVQRADDRNYYFQDASLFDTLCVREQNMDAWIDSNNDGIFDENAERVTFQNDNQDNSQKIQYTLQIQIPQLNRRNYQAAEYRMRILLLQDNSDLRACNNQGYGEARDYTVRIIPKNI